MKMRFQIAFSMGVPKDGRKYSLQEAQTGGLEVKALPEGFKWDVGQSG